MALEDKKIAAAVMSFLIMISSESLSREIGCNAAHTSRWVQQAAWRKPTCKATK
jgi:transposase-like protein